MVNKALCYGQGTKYLMLTYRRPNSLEIKGYSDAIFAVDKYDRKFTSRYVFTVVRGAISCRISK
jgi:hypothetical protein